MDVWSKATLKSLLPGSVLLLVVAMFLETGWVTLALPTLIVGGSNLLGATQGEKVVGHGAKSRVNHFVVHREDEDVAAF